MTSESSQNCSGIFCQH